MTRRKAVPAPATEPKSELPVFADPVFVVRTCNEDMTSHGGFRWNGVDELTIAPDFKPIAECGYGLHGLEEGDGDWSLLNWDASAKALLVETDRSQLIEIGGKVKFESGIVREIGSLAKLICERLTRKLCNADRIKADVKAIAKAVEIDAASGEDSKLAASGAYSKLAASGAYSNLAASGEYSKLAASGADSNLAASGEYSKLAASGASSNLAASGAYSNLAASGASSKLAASGEYSKLAASGAYSNLAASGAYSNLAASGEYSKLAASGASSNLAASGAKSIAAGMGYNSTAAAGENGCIVLTWWDGTRPRVTVGYIGEDGLEPNVYYRLDGDGKFVRIAEVKP